MPDRRDAIAERDQIAEALFEQKKPGGRNAMDVVMARNLRYACEQDAALIAPFIEAAFERGRVAEREQLRAGIEGLRENLANATDRAIYRDGVLVEALALIDAKTNFWGPDGEDTGSP